TVGTIERARTSSGNREGRIAIRRDVRAESRGGRGRRRSGRGGRRRGRGRRHAHPWFPVLTRTDQCSATPVEALARHALRGDVGGALFEAHRSLEVLLAWLVLRDRGSTQDEHRENPKARSCVLFHRSSSARVDSASGLTGNGLRREGAPIGRRAYGTPEPK